MYKYDDKSTGSQNRLHGQPIATFEQSPQFYSDGFVGRVNPFTPAKYGLITSIPSPGLGDPTVQIVSPRPNISDLVDYLDATVRARGRVTVPTQKVNFLVKLDPPNKSTWWKRLWEDPLKKFPTVRVTVELVQVGVSLFPISNYRGDVLLSQSFNEYLTRLHSKKPPCSTDFVTALGGLFGITAKGAIEKELGINGQLDTLIKKSNTKLPMSAQDEQRHFWTVYATFPTEIRKYVIPETRVVLDEFIFDKSSLTQNHIGKILAIARHSEAMAASVGTGFTIGLAGHTDDRGTEKYNIDLGDRRASEVKEALRKAIEGIGPGLSSKFTIMAKSFGETKPLVKAKTEAEHARNRRVEVLLLKQTSRCPRVSLRVVVKRALGLLPRLSDSKQAQRISCLLRKVIQKGTDDRWIDKQRVGDVENASKSLGTYPFNLLRDYLSLGDIFEAAVPDAQVLRTLESLDGEIIGGINKVIERMEVLTNAASTGASTPGMKEMDALRAWMFKRTNDNQSIYNCYRII